MITAKGVMKPHAEAGLGFRDVLSLGCRGLCKDLHEAF